MVNLLDLLLNAATGGANAVAPGLGSAVRGVASMWGQDDPNDPNRKGQPPVAPQQGAAPLDPSVMPSTSSIDNNIRQQQQAAPTAPPQGPPQAPQDSPQGPPPVMGPPAPAPQMAPTGAPQGPQQPAPSGSGGSNWKPALNTLFNSFARLGPQIYAMGLPQSSDSRARIAAGMAGSSDQTQDQMLLRSRQQQEMDAQKQKMGGVDLMRGMMNDPAIVAGMTPAQRAAMNAAAAAGNPMAFSAVLRDITMANKPIGMGPGASLDPQSGTYTDLQQGIQYVKGPDGKYTPTPMFGGGEGQTGTGATGQTGTTGTTGEVPEGFDPGKLQGVAPQIQTLAKQYAEGQIGAQQIPVKLRPIVIDKASQYAGPGGIINYTDRTQMDKSLHSGTIYNNTIKPANNSVQHLGGAVEAYDRIGNLDVGLGGKNLNTAINTMSSIGNKDMQRNLEEFREKMRNAGMEAKKAINGTGQITDFDKAEVEKMIDPSQTPSQIKAKMATLYEQLHDNLGTVAGNANTTYRSKKYTADGFLYSQNSKDSQARIQKFIARDGGGRAAPKAGDVMDGHRFKGGNPGDAANWEAVQ